MSYLATERAAMVSVTCYKCGIEFYVPRHFNTERHEDQQTFWCPNGHPQIYTESTTTRLKRQLAVAERARDEAQARALREADAAQHERRRVAAAKGQATRLRHRLQEGTCPCCDRTFKHLARHMSSQHPEYASTEPSE